ncbi:hypothetical protein SLNWT_5195 [Streptomyces albus]|uniref:Uncharacterized protein n=1 Tax=Streptomyces albus (strain ATCC 21838 / DSM 41398 / FERM P-419 / JCM 4703 / NBRC 107858) TaxID=1081613 RepID=A0A0B5F3T0_STRA4|nr:hypothetical protein SLNWT_5195 [Streptomyces albus]AOU79874.1 hypothetical protein SLNHY_5183 [Streptomyces albus]
MAKILGRQRTQTCLLRRTRRMTSTEATARDGETGRPG